MTQSRFERDTAVERVDAHRYRGTIDAGWAVMKGAAANGGYVMALAARAMRSPLPHPDPVTLTAHFLASPDPGPVDIEVEVLRSGGLPAPPIVRRFDHRVPAELAGWTEGRPLGRGQVGGYVRW